MLSNLVSIITANYNSERFIEYTIESIISQTYQNWELIIVDDCSTDKSVAIINDYIKNDTRIKLILLSENSGTGVARNKAIEMSNGSYIAFLDSDDAWLPNKLELQIEFMNKNNFNFTFTSYNRIDEDGKDLNSIITCKKTLSYNQMLYSNKVGCLTAMYNAENLGKIYMPIIRKRQDYALWLKLLKIEKRAYGLDIVLAKYRIRRNSISNNKIEMLKWNWLLFRKIEKLSFLRSLYLVLSNIFIKIIKG